MKPVRCAIYTRKSSDEGLDQNFNSLDAQREACAAYVCSQASEGWVALPDLYDDGGISGGTLERPALQRLLGDVAAGRIDVIVVYKVDRLSRSLFDFARLVELLEKGNASFVSITQPINNTTSMGRLTLNMLLSFAQFEREVTAERIRDKIAASKAKGMFMGGVPPIGYRCDGRTLAIVPEHAAIVRDVFRRYVEVGNVRLLQEALERDRILTPRRSLDSGRTIGGLPFARAQLRVILKSRLYLGEIPYKGEIYNALHDPIIDRSLWDAVQVKIAGHAQGGERSAYHRSRSLLASRIVDGAGEPLIPVHSSKPALNGNEGRRRFSYYVSRALHHARSRTGMRVPAREIEGLVVAQLAELFGDAIELIVRARLAVAPDLIKVAAAQATVVVARIRQCDHQVITALVDRVAVLPYAVEIICAPRAIEAALGLPPTESGEPVILTVPARITRSGLAVRLIQGGVAPPETQQSLIRLIIQARAWWSELRLGIINITGLSAREQMVPSYVTRVVRLAFLAPAVVDAILAGRHTASLTAAALVAPEAVSPLWHAQVTILSDS